jgi:hypothetical protein
LRASYEGAIDGIRDRVERTSSAGPDMAAIRAGLAATLRPVRPHRGRSGIVVAVASMAALALVALGTWLTLERARSPAEPDLSPSVLVRDPGTPSATEVRPGQWIQTQGTETRLSDSRVADLKMGPYTRLQVGAWEINRTVLFLDEGRVDVSVRHLNPDETFEVRTALAQIRVVGTRFRTVHRPGVETVVTCVEGEVKVETLAEVELARVRAGFEVRVTRDGVEGPRPVTLDLDAIERPALPAPSSYQKVLPSAPVAPPEPLLASIRATPSATRPDVVPAPAPGTPPAPGDVLEDARRRLDQSQAQEAIEAIRRALEAGTVPEPRLLALLGDALRIVGRPEEARVAYERSAAGATSEVPEGVLVDLALLLQQDLGRSRDAERTWWQYLALHPRGRHVAQALGGLAALAGDDGRAGECLAIRSRLLAEQPGAPEAARAFADAGRDMLARRATEDAWTWFAARRGDPMPALAETALAGMVQVRIQQGRTDEARAIANEHLRRFPGGVHGDEVRAFLSGNRPSIEQMSPWR